MLFPTSMHISAFHLGSSIGGSVKGPNVLYPGAVIQSCNLLDPPLESLWAESPRALGNGVELFIVEFSLH
jgi:hypothetical protein